jgi:hypothetical protein
MQGHQRQDGLPDRDVLLVGVGNAGVCDAARVYDEKVVIVRHKEPPIIRGVFELLLNRRSDKAHIV